jgi:hypothetical protein
MAYYSEEENSEMYRNAEDVERDLAVPYSGPTKEKNGFTYIPWTDSRKALDHVAGSPLNWELHNPVIAIDPEHGIYTAAVQITIHVVDENGVTRDISRVGFGRSTAQATKEEREQNLTVTRSLQLHDTAAAAAGTDAFSRACKMFGPALGSDLYDTEAPTRPSSAPRSTGKGPSEKQTGILRKIGYTDAQIADMPFATWKGKVDEYFADKNGTTTPALDEAPF